MSGFIPTEKIDKVDVGEGVILHGQVSCANRFTLDRWVESFKKFIVNMRSMATKDQVEIDFRSGVTIPGVALRADKPKLRDREYSIGIDMKNVSMEDRSKLFAMSQDDSKEIHISITAQDKRSYKLDEPAKPADEKAPTSETNPAPDEASQPSGETKGPVDESAAPRPPLVDHSAGKLELPTFIADSLEERLQVALLIRDKEAIDRWAGRIKAGLTDRDMIKAIASEWAGEIYEAPDDGKHFIVQGGNSPRFRLAPARGVRAQINNKPTLQGSKLIAKAREVLGLAASIPKASHKGKATKDTKAA